MADKPDDDSVADRQESMADRQELVTERTLQLVEKQIGRGEPPSAEEWEDLRALAGDNEDAKQLVNDLQSLVERFDAQLRAKYGAGQTSVDLPRLRAGLSHLIRQIVRKKSGETVTPPRDAN